MVLRLVSVLALTFALVSAAIDAPSGTPTGSGMGSPILVLEPKSGRTTTKHPSGANNTVSMFCGAKVKQDDPDYMRITRVRWSKFRNPESTALTDANEVEGYEQTAPASNNTVTLNLGQPPVTAMGKYRCDLWDGDTFVATGNLMVNMRPVFVQEDNQRLDPDDKDAFKMNGGGYTVTEGGDLSLSCRALGNPAPTYQWFRDGKPLKHGGKYSIRGHILNISKVEEADRSEYKCVATNSFTAKEGSPKQNYEASVTYKLRIKSALAWLWPLLAIIITAILLAVIIIACEYRRKKREQQSRGLEPDEED